jgi:AcrR family transcriptional regulator
LPRIVNHERRRGELAEIAARLIAKGGVDAATVRAVALEAGYSTKVVSHYFPEKRALMLLTYRHAVSRSQELTEASQVDGGGDAAAFLQALLPSSEAMRLNWLVWLAFWGVAASDEQLAAEQRLRVRDVTSRIAAILANDPRRRAAEAGLHELAASLFSTVLGVAMQAVFDPANWPRQRQVAIVDQALNSLLSR